MTTMRQQAPYPHALHDLVDKLVYRPGWEITLWDSWDRGQGSEGMTLIVKTLGYDTYHSERGQHYAVNHYFPVPPAAFTRRSWQHWLFEQLQLVEKHEAMEFFVIDGERPYAPHHGEGEDPYIVWVLGTIVDQGNSFRSPPVTD